MTVVSHSGGSAPINIVYEFTGAQPNLFEPTGKTGFDLKLNVTLATSNTQVILAMDSTALLRNRHIAYHEEKRYDSMAPITLPSLKDAGIAFQLLNHIEQLHAWIKDSNGKFVVTNTLFSERFGFTCADAMVGLTDYDISPEHLVNRYLEDDKRVLNGAIISNRLELIVCKNDSANWFRTSKWPIYDFDENIIGSYGISTQLSSSKTQNMPIRELATPIEYIQQNFSDAISIEKLAQACHVSVSTLERRFKKHLSKTPLQYLLEVRLDNAKMMLFETNRNISNIAQETGFVDNSHFTRSYKKRFSISPRDDRKRQSSAESN